MKTLLGISIFIALLVCSIVAAQSQTTQTTQTEGKTHHQELRDRVQKYYDAWNTGDLDKAGVYYAKDADLIFYDVTPLEYHGWAEYKAGVQKLLSGYSSLKLAPNNDLKIGGHGRFAWTALTFHLLGTLKDGTKSDTECRHTAVWEKRKGEWLVIHEHVSAPLSQH